MSPLGAAFLERGLLFPKGAEITRDTPPGHFNAIFPSDVRPLDTPDFVGAIKRANEQGTPGFTFSLRQPHELPAPRR